MGDIVMLSCLQLRFPSLSFLLLASPHYFFLCLSAVCVNLSLFQRQNTSHAKCCISEYFESSHRWAETCFKRTCDSNLKVEPFCYVYFII